MLRLFEDLKRGVDLALDQERNATAESEAQVRRHKPCKPRESRDKHGTRDKQVSHETSTGPAATSHLFEGETSLAHPVAAVPPMLREIQPRSAVCEGSLGASRNAYGERTRYADNKPCQVYDEQDCIDKVWEWESRNAHAHVQMKTRQAAR